MILSILFLVAIVGVQSTPIKNGEIVTDIKAHPYVVRLFFLGRYWKNGEKVLGRSVCTGILVKEDFVVTAAHCIEDEIEPPLIIIKAGTTDLSSGDTLQTASGKSYKKHSNYNPEASPNPRKPYGDHDIAVVWLDEKLKIKPGVKLANLESKFTDLTNGIGVVVGWGSTSKEMLPTTLQRIKMIVSPKDTCEGIITNRLNNQFCATGKSHPDTGDSGGPFVINKIVFGVTSWINLDGRIMTVFVRVYPYFDWIQRNYKRGPPNTAANSPAKQNGPNKSDKQNQPIATRIPNEKNRPGNKPNTSGKPNNVNPNKNQNPSKNTNKKPNKQSKNKS